MIKKLILLLFFLIPNLALASEWKGDWCGDNGRIFKCFWNIDKGMLIIPPETLGIANFFPDAPIMAKVAKAESGGRQFNADGSVVENKVTHDYGLFQINYRWIPTAEKMGYDIMTLGGNLAMGRLLYDQYGLQPWNSSKANWSK